MRYHSFNRCFGAPAFDGWGGGGHHSGHHFHRWFSQMMGPNQRVERGEIRYLILDVLSDKARHGYDIIQEIEIRSQGIYKPSTGAVYPTLQMLEESGYIRSRNEDGRKLYEITDEGREELERNRDYVEEIYGRISWPFSLFHGESFLDLSEQLEKILWRIRSLFQRGGVEPGKLDEIRLVLKDASEKIDEILKRKKG